MRLLLDTHVVLWMLDDSPRLTTVDRRLITSADTQCYVSVASWWELAIKQSRGIATFAVSLEEIRNATLDSGVQELSISGAHALRVAELPLLLRDPFDRLLIAQALCEPMRLVTADTVVASYAAVCGVLMDRVGA